MSEAVSEAAARLERAVGRLAEALAAPRPSGGIPPERIAELAGRLDNTLARLRGALAELDGADGDPHDPAMDDGDDSTGHAHPPANIPDEER
ncbi:MAG: hypothetical protein JWP20_2196 [Roseomonas sp.]|jgi:hypothetical protein|nr:hypothetical protein [Roseomonas sp.]